MRKVKDYNIKKYVDSIIEVRNMTLDAILNRYRNCKEYSLRENVSGYLKYIEEKPFYIAPSVSDVKTEKRMSTFNPKFMLFSAPGATGKSALAKHIAHRFGALYWNLAKVKIGTNSFAGSILQAVGPENYSEFIKDLKNGDILLVIDALDEAEIVSGRKMINEFIAEIDESISDHSLPSVILLARTETAQYIASFCTENSISVLHYEIGFFTESSAKEFILQSITGEGSPSKPDIECTNSYYDAIRRNITDGECESFLGYAPVLEAIAAHIKQSPNRSKMISDLSQKRDCTDIILKIMEDLLTREQEKVVLAFKEKCKEKYPNFTQWDSVYSMEEQLMRVICYILFQDTKYENYQLDFLPSQLIDDYQELLDTFMAQHPFIRNYRKDSGNMDFTGPAFRDYSLAKVILKNEFSELADTYFSESQSQSYFPSQIFFDCYMKISENNVYPNHISYVYDSFKAKATAYERPYLQCYEICPTEESDVEYCAEFGMKNGKQQMPKRHEFPVRIINTDSPLQFEQLVNVSIDMPNMEVSIGRQKADARICNSSVICKKIRFSTKNITIESFSPEECLLVSKEDFVGDIPLIDIIRADNLKVSAPNLSNYYKLFPYKYDFEDISSMDKTKFIHALHCILREFRTHRKDVLAKTAERIDFVVVGSSEVKKQVLSYLKDRNIIYKEAHLYKVNEVILQSKGIYLSALNRMDADELQPAFLDFCNWDQKQHF